MAIITKKCSKCGEIKSISEFNINNKLPSGYTSQCKKCRKLYYTNNRERLLEVAKKKCKKYRKNNKEKLIKIRREFYINNRDKVIRWVNDWRQRNPKKTIEYSRNRRAMQMESGGKISSKDWLALCDFYGNVCLCCGRDDVKLTLDHVVPLKLGGRHSIENVQPLCHSCNARKGIRIVDYRPPNC